jgi:hypothetical protein
VLDWVGYISGLDGAARGPGDVIGDGGQHKRNGDELHLKSVEIRESIEQSPGMEVLRRTFKSGYVQF